MGCAELRQLSFEQARSLLGVVETSRQKSFRRGAVDAACGGAVSQSGAGAAGANVVFFREEDEGEV